MRIGCWAAGWMAVHVFCLIGFMFWLEGCATGLQECGLGCGYDPAYGSV